MRPIKVGTSWRIELADNTRAGWYMTQQQAEQGITKRMREAKRDFSNTRLALAEFDANKPFRDKLWQNVKTNDDVTAAEDVEAAALQRVRDAYWEDTEDINSRDHLADLDFMRRMAE